MLATKEIERDEWRATGSKSRSIPKLIRKSGLRIQVKRIEVEVRASLERR